MQGNPLQTAVLHLLCADGTARRLRIRNGYTLTEIGALVGVTESAVSRWETGNRVPRGEAAQRYSELIRTFLDREAGK